ncbi:MAG: ATP-binding protein [Chloroflexota bacterium]|nr:ATP-binding protein [Chloroflexota bacterium]
MAINEDSQRSATDAVFAGDSEMGALMQALDWSATPLGPVGDWPQSLRTAISICLASRFPMLIWWGPDLVMLYNDAYRPIIGTKHPAAMGQRGRQCWPEIWNVIGPMLSSVLAQGEATWSEDQLLLLDRNGYVEECYFTFSYSPIRDESGGIGGVFTAVTETTERVLAERRLRTLRALAGAAAEARTAADACRRAVEMLAENPTDIPFVLLYLLDADGATARLASAAHLAADTPTSPAVIPLNGESSDVGWPIARVATTNEAVRLDDLAHRFSALPGGPWDAPPRTALILPIPSRTQEQLTGLLIVGISPRRALDESYGAFCGLVAGQIATAIGNAQAYEEERQRAEALAELDRAKTAFFSNISHEFRTPLTLILGPIVDALNDTQDALAPTQRERLEIAQRNGVRLQRLVNSLLDFSRIEAGRAEASYEPTDLATFTRELAGLFRSAIERAGLRLTVDCPPLPAPVHVDRVMWEKIVLNLLSNALKFTFDGAITVRLRTDGNRVVLTVADTGTGIPPEEAPHLFERFHRVRGARARTFEGSGIGLALVQEIVRLHGGDVSATSAIGEGTTFTVAIPTGTAHLPANRIATGPTDSTAADSAAPYVEEALRWLPDGADRDAASEDGAEAAWRNAGSGAPIEMLAGARILLADDNADMRAYARRLLRDNYAIETVADGAAALAAARERPPDVILTDVMMPQMDGFALLRALRADPRTRDIPVIFLSARAGEESAIEGIAAGADGYLVKPFSARELQARVAASLAMARLRQERVRAEQVARAEAERERERIYATLLQAPVGIGVFRGPEHIVEFANPRVCDLWGRTLEQVLGKPIFESLPEATGQGFEALLDGVLATGVPFVGSELPVRLDREGRHDLVYFNLVYAPVHGPSGEIRGVIVVATEVSEQVQLRARAEEERQQFIAMVAHELRNPITSLMGYAQLMKRRERYDAKAMETIIAQAQRLDRLTIDLRETVRARLGALAVAPGPVDVRSLVFAAVEQAQATTETHTITVEIPDALPPARWDADRVAQVLSNLLLNGIKYSESGEIRVHVTDAGASVRIVVADHGIGIPPEALPHIFEPFYRAENAISGSRRGMGLGLPISKSLIEAHGGEMRVESRVGEGSAFTLTLPYDIPSP